MLNIISAEDIIDNSWSIIDVVRRRAPIGWRCVFKDADNELEDISDIIENDKKIHGQYFPDTKNLFKAFEMTPLNQVKVVITGQDPYHGINHDGTPQAQGMSFSVKRGTKIPSSLVNIFKEIKNTTEGFRVPSHGDLSRWARQGVLLLNSCLTVRPGNPGSHKELWYSFIKKVINAILNTNPNCIFIMWGRQAQKIKKMLGERATILEAAHPSGRSAFQGFFGCNHFNMVNQLLMEKGIRPIDWNIDP